MLLLNRGMLVPHDTDKSLLEFIEPLINEKNRYCVGAVVPGREYIIMAEGYFELNVDSVIILSHNAYGRGRPLYLNAWNHVIYVVPSNKTNKKFWLHDNINALIEAHKLYWKVQRRVKACQEI